MKTYRFELEYKDGFVSVYETCGVNLFMANKMLLEYLKELPNPEDIVTICVECLDEEDE